MNSPPIVTAQTYEQALDSALWSESCRSFHLTGDPLAFTTYDRARLLLIADMVRTGDYTSERERMRQRMIKAEE